LAVEANQLPCKGLHGLAAGERTIAAIQLFFEENGSYIGISAVAGRPLQVFRNWMIARKMGVRNVRIGPRSYLRGLAFISMGEDFSAGEGLWLEAVSRYGDQSFHPRLVIGRHVRLSHWCHITCNHAVTIGDHVLMGSKVFIGDHNHGSYGASGSDPAMPPALRPLEQGRSVTIGPNVWLGDGVVVCPDVTMGEGSVAGANAVVTTDVAPFTMVAGVPARAIRRYDPRAQSWVKI